MQSKLMAEITPLTLSTPAEIGRELGARLRAQRLAQELTQDELARRAGLSGSTIKALESKGQASLGSLLHVVLALGLADELQGLFVLKLQSIAQMERAERAQRQRAPRRPRR